MFIWFMKERYGILKSEEAIMLRFIIALEDSAINILIYKSRSKK